MSNVLKWLAFSTDVLTGQGFGTLIFVAAIS